MKGKISKQELDLMWRDDPLAAAVWERWISMGQAVLTNTEQNIAIMEGGNYPGTTEA
jgi:hypothetical protein